MTSKRRRHRNATLRNGRTMSDPKPEPPPGKVWCPGCGTAHAVRVNGFVADHQPCGRSVFVGREPEVPVMPLVQLADGAVVQVPRRGLFTDRAQEAYTAERGKCRVCGKVLYGDRTLCGACGVRLGT